MFDISQLAADVAAAIPVGAAELAIIVMVVSGAFWFVVNNLIKPIFSSIFRSMYYTVNISNHDSIYTNLNNWLFRNSKHIHFSRVFRAGRTADGTELVPGEGTFLVRVPDYPIMLINRKIENEDWRGEVDTLNIRFFTRNVLKLAAFYDILREEDAPPNLVHKSDYGSWGFFGTRKEVATLVSAAAQSVEDDLVNFLSEETKALYARRGIAYRRGYLLTGQPGTGKSNLIAYLSSKLDLPIYTILGGNMSADGAASILNSLDNKKTAIVLLEDADLSMISTKRHNVKIAGKLEEKNCDGDDSDIKADEDDDENKGAQLLQSFLNALDGILHVDNFVFFCTTNNVDDLDPALIRPGRLDVHVELEPLTHVEQAQYINYFYDMDQVGAYPPLGSRTIAELVHVLSKHINDPEAAIAELVEATDSPPIRAAST